MVVIVHNDLDQYSQILQWISWSGHRDRDEVRSVYIFCWDILFQKDKFQYFYQDTSQFRQIILTCTSETLQMPRRRIWGSSKWAHPSLPGYSVQGQGWWEEFSFQCNFFILLVLWNFPIISLKNIGFSVSRDQYSITSS
jgi:hypothetical protein